jgi:hypothetical protein
MHPRFLDIGGYLKTIVSALNGAASAAVNGSAVQLVGPGYDYQSCQFVVASGAATGSPTGISVAGKIQDSADGSTGWADVAGAAITAITQSNGQANINVNLRGTRGYIRAVVTPTFTGGASPAIPVAGILVLGGASEDPAV